MKRIVPWIENEVVTLFAVAVSVPDRVDLVGLVSHMRSALVNLVRLADDETMRTAAVAPANGRGAVIVVSKGRRPPARQIVLLNLVVLLGACTESTEIPQPLDEFTAVAQRLRDSDQEHQGKGRMRELEQVRASEPLSRAELIELEVMLAQQKLIHGETVEAAALIDRALRKTEIDMGFGARLDSRYEFMLKERALIYMRLAENQNCVDNHSPESCIYPIKGGGVHTFNEHTTEAHSTLLSYLERQPDDYVARWLLNIVAMTLGDHPESVPEKFRIFELPETQDAPIAPFRNVAAELGIDSVDLAGAAMVEDFDGDGLLDIVTSTSDSFGPLKYFARLADGGFEDRTETARLDEQLGGLNAVTADYDNDGDMDMLVLRGGWMKKRGHIRNSLLRNEADGTFTDVTRSAGIAAALPTQAAAWADFDNDGDLDLYVANETMKDVPPEVPVYEGSGFKSNLYLNDGQGAFVDEAEARGATNDRYAKGVTVGDFDNDGDVDIYVSNLGPNRLYRNRGDGFFEDVAPALGLTSPDLSFAPWFFDADNDGSLDLFVGAYDAYVEDVARDHLGEPFRASPPALYLNAGDGTFADAAERFGLGHAYMPMGGNFGDLDNDGFLDIYLGTGRPGLENLVPNVMLRNAGGRHFDQVTVAGGFGHLQKGHGIAFNDLDHDGDQDIFHQLGGFYAVDRYANALFMNPGNDNRFVKVVLRGRESNHFGIGARIHVQIETPSGPRSVHRAVGSVSSFGGSSLVRQEIGLGDASRIATLSVWWPKSSTRSDYADVPLDSMIEIEEGAPQIKVIGHGPAPFLLRDPSQQHEH